MYGTHHKTGKQIRLIQQSTSTWRSKKTLVWLDVNCDINQPYNRYDVGLVGSRDYDYLTKHNIVVDVIVCTDTQDIEWIRNGGYKNVNILVSSKYVLDSIGLQYLKEHNITNILCLDEFHLLYPFMGSAWDNTKEDACVLVGLLLRFGKMYNVEKSNRYTYGLEVLSGLPIVPKLMFITQYYVPKQSKRAKEIDICLKKNIENPLIDSIVLLNEKDESNHYIESSKISQIVIKKRLYYDEVIRYIHDSVPKNTIVVFANADIYLDSTIRHVYSTNLDNTFLALLRYEGGKIFGPRADSQDSWVLTSDSVKERSAIWKYDSLHFSFGVSGCDNAITCEMLRMKYLVVNPALTIQTHHVHDSEIRTYDKDEIVDKNVYLYIEPTGLHDMEAVTALPTTSVCTKLVYKSFDRPLQSNMNKSATYCKMLEKDKRYIFNATDVNTFESQSIPVYKFDQIFQTNHGLAYSYNKIYVGPSKASQNMWSESRLSTLSPSVRVKKGYVVPLPEEMCNSSELYLLYYLPKILALRKEFGNDGEFWCPNKKDYVEALQMFKWNTNKMPLLSQTDNESAFMDSAYVVFPSDKAEVTAEEMTLLREFLRDFGSEESVVVCMDEIYINKEFVKEIESKYTNIKVVFQSTSLERKLSAFQSASTIILYCTKETQWAWRYIWAAPPNANLVTIMNEMEMNGEIHHIASSCNLRHTIHIVPKGALSVTMRERILNNVSPSSTVSIPTIYVPNPLSCEQFYKHTGDSFREIIDLWEERGYIKKVYTHCKNVWLHSVGDTLLYDRPNYDWIKNAPAEEQVWKKALFGNPKPIGNNSKSWSFWARRPRLVEAMLDTPVQKTKNLVFYGCTENAIQKKHRTTHDWSSVCDASGYYMASGSEKPKFSEQEYLTQLSQSHYGLCLAGFGNKCHREVECMAFGTVPVCSSEVDMTHYASPPVEGLHYVRVTSPEDLKNKLSQIDDDVWYRMSQACKAWYKENCSVEGMWNLTKKLVA